MTSYASFMYKGIEAISINQNSPLPSGNVGFLSSHCGPYFCNTMWKNILAPTHFIPLDEFIIHVQLSAESTSVGWNDYHNCEYFKIFNYFDERDWVLFKSESDLLEAMMYSPNLFAGSSIHNRSEPYVQNI